MARNFRIAILFILLGSFFPARALFYKFVPDNDKITISASDKKKLDKAEKEIQKSAEMMKEADKYYAELATKQAELTSEESDNLNNKALDKQIEALKMKQSGNNKKFGIYSGIANEFWKKYQGTPDELGYPKAMESEARNNFQSSQDQIKEAEDTKDKLLIYSKLSNATELQTKAVESITKAVDIYLTTQLTPSPSSQTMPMTIQSKPADSISKPNKNLTLADSLPKADLLKPEISNQHKEDTVDRNFTQQQISSTPANTKTDTSKNENANSTGRSAEPSSNIYTEDKINKDLKKENQQISPLNSSSKETVNETSVNFSEKPTKVPIHAANEKTEKKGRIEKGENNTYKKRETQNINNSRTSETNFKQTRFEVKTSDKIGDNGFYYVVQIAASRVSMNENMLKKIYGGPEKANENIEDDWYKYTIGPFNSFFISHKFLEICGVKGAFIIEFVNGKKIIGKESFVEPMNNSNNLINYTIPKNISFKVQIAASRTEASSEYLKKIFNDPQQLDNINEEGWFKYSVNCGNNYNEACELLKNINIRGAFISIYRDNERISIKDVFK